MFRLASISLLAVLGGCSTVQPVVALPSASPEDVRAEAKFVAEGRLERLRSQDARVATVAYRLNVAAVDLCEDKALIAGMGIHHALEYVGETRETAIPYFGLAGRPAVSTVVPDGPAAKAGIRANDTLISADGVLFPDLGAQVATGKATYDETIGARKILDEALADGSATLVVERNSERHTVKLTPVAACAYEAAVLPSETLDARADGRRIFITSAFVRYTVTDDQLAIVLGHELGHNVMKHRARIESGGTGAILGNAGTTIGGLLTVEREADYVGLYLMARAGYDYGSARNFWREYGADYGKSQYASLTNPGSLARAVNSIATAEEIRQKIARGEPLVPTPARLKATSSQ